MTFNFLLSELVSGSVETIGEEKARKVLDRVDFLSKLREEVVTHPELKEKLENLAEMALDQLLETRQARRLAITIRDVCIDE